MFLKVKSWIYKLKEYTWFQKKKLRRIISTNKYPNKITGLKKIKKSCIIH